MYSQQFIQYITNQLRTLEHTEAESYLDLTVHVQCLLSSCVYMRQNLDYIREGQVCMHIFDYSSAEYFFCFSWCTRQDAALTFV